MPVGRMRSFRIFALIRLALAGDARATFPQGKAGVRTATSAAGLLAMTYVFNSVLKYRRIATPGMRYIKV